jgi:hypothetical protein
MGYDRYDLIAAAIMAFVLGFFSGVIINNFVPRQSPDVVGGKQLASITTPDGYVIYAPEGYTIDIEFDGSSTTPETLRHVIQRGSAKGVGVQTTSHDNLSSLNSEAPSVTLNGSTATGGSTSYILELVGKKPEGMALMVIAGLMIAGGVVIAIWTGNVKFGGALAVAGVVLMGVVYISTTYPYLWIVGFVVLLAVGAYMVWESRARTRLDTTATSIVTGIEMSDDELTKEFDTIPVDKSLIPRLVSAAKRGIKSAIGHNSDEPVVTKSVVSKIKEKEGL